MIRYTYYINRDMLISFVIPAFNAEKYIERSVRSIFALDRDDVQVVVVDDGSIDCTMEILGQLSKQYPKQIKVISQKNAGVSVARNNGLIAAEGKYIAFVDADDEIKPEDYHKLIQLLDLDYDCVMFGYDVVGKTTLVKYPPLAEGIQTEETIRKMEKMVLDFAVSENIASNYLGGKVFQYLIKKEFLMEHQIRFPVGIAYAEDMCFVIALFRALNHIYIAHVSAYSYYINVGSAMHHFNKKFWHNWMKVIVYLEEQYSGEYNFSKLIVCNGVGSINHFLEYYNLKNSVEIYALIKEVIHEERMQRSICEFSSVNWTTKERKIIQYIQKKDVASLMLNNIWERVKRKILR